MKEYKISLCMSSIRPWLWPEIIDSIKGNKYPIEIVFVGDQKPTAPLPENVQYHYATCKPAQAYQISFFRAKGELILWTADDAIYNFQNPNNLDILYDYFKSFNRKDLAIGMRAIEDGHDVTKNHRFFGKQIWSPIMYPFCAVDREFFHKIGGYDKKFICGQSENCVVMRIYEIGGEGHLCNNSFVCVDHVHKHNWAKTNSNGFRFWYPKDREALENAWCVEGYGYYNKHKKATISKTRLFSVESYENKNDICFVTQGEKGSWN